MSYQSLSSLFVSLSLLFPRLLLLSPRGRELKPPGRPGRRTREEIVAVLVSVVHVLVVRSFSSLSSFRTIRKAKSEKSARRGEFLRSPAERENPQRSKAVGAKETQNTQSLPGCLADLSPPARRSQLTTVLDAVRSAFGLGGLDRGVGRRRCDSSMCQCLAHPTLRRRCRAPGSLQAPPRG